MTLTCRAAGERASKSETVFVYAIVREVCRFLRPRASILPSRLTETIGSQCEDCHGAAAADAPRSSAAGAPALLRSLSAEEARRRLAAEREAR